MIICEEIRANHSIRSPDYRGGSHVKNGVAEAANVQNVGTLGCLRRTVWLDVDTHQLRPAIGNLCLRQQLTLVGDKSLPLSHYGG